MNDNREFLNFIYQNVEMGKTTIPKLLDIAKEPKIRDLLQEQLQDYRAIADEARQLMTEQGGEIKDIGVMQKAGAHIMLNMQTMADNSPSHIAEMMMNGSNMGIIEAQKHLNQYPNADPRIRHLAQDMMRVEQRNLDRLKPFLK